MIFLPWQPLRMAASLAASINTQTWLREQGSLTQRLIQCSDQQFEVQLLHQHWGLPHLDECQALGLRNREHALIREVILKGKGQPWVYARSIMPRDTIKNRGAKLSRLGNQSLGQTLFNDPSLERGAINITQLPSTLLPACVEPDKLGSSVWGRRSIFLIQHQPLLVAEFFLPACTQYACPK